MSKVSKDLALLISCGTFIVLFWVLMYSLMPKSVTIKINCDVAEISPDIPIQAKELCRKARSGRI